MRVFYLVAARLKRIGTDPDLEDISTTFACEAAPDLDGMINYAREIGFAATIDVEKIETIELSESPANGLSFFCGWAATNALTEDSDLKPAHVPDERDVRLNELERGVRNTDRKLEQILALLANPPRTAAEHNERTTDPSDPRRSARRARAGDPDQAEFTGSSHLEHPERQNAAGVRGGSMGLVGTPASPSRGANGTTKILSASIDSDGKPVIIEEKPMTVGDSLRRGT